MEYSEEAILVQLTGQWNSCPAYWRNFIRSLNLVDESTKDRNMIIADELIEHNVSRIFEDSMAEPRRSVLVFATSGHYLMFILRFG